MKTNNTFNSRVIAQIKNIFKANEQDYNKVERLRAKCAELQKEIEELAEGINLAEARVTRVTGGYSSKDIIEVVVTPVFNEDGTPKLDEKGYQQKKKQYVLKYPDTIIPPTIEDEVNDAVEVAAESFNA